MIKIDCKRFRMPRTCQECALKYHDDMRKVWRCSVTSKLVGTQGKSPFCPLVFEDETQNERTLAAYKMAVKSLEARLNYYKNRRQRHDCNS